MAYHIPRDESPSFAQTGEEFHLDSDVYDEDEDDDLRSQVGGSSSETYEMVSGGKRRQDQYKIGGGHSSERLMEGDYVDAGPSTAGGGGRGRGLSVSSVESFQLYTPDEDKAVRRKFDRKLVLFVALLYMLSFLDRSSESHCTDTMDHVLWEKLDLTNTASP
jgi:hypothetical protein